VRLQYRIRNYRFFFLPPLYIALLAFLFTLRNRLHLWAAVSLAVFALGTNLFPYLLAHYLAAVTCLFLLAAVAGLRRLGGHIAAILLLLCFAEFSLWYTLHFFENFAPPHPLLQYETWDSIPHRSSAARRVYVARQLAAIPGDLLVFVHYAPNHVFQEEWVWNAADIDRARVVFARDLGPDENAKLIPYYPKRRVLYLEPDYETPQISSEAP